MRYNKGDRVVLRTDLEDGEFIHPVYWDSHMDQWGKWNVKGVVIEQVDASDESYRLVEPRYWIAEDMIDHDATAELNGEVSWEDFVKEFYNNPRGDTTPDTEDSLSLTIHVHGAKEYRDKLEELHRQIETVERTIEQLNEMDMKIEVEEG